MVAAAATRILSQLVRPKALKAIGKGIGNATMEGLVGTTPREMRLSPLAGLAGLTLGGAGTAAIAGPVSRRIRGRDRHLAQAVKMQERQWIQDKVRQLESRRLERDMAENAARLASVAPDVYNRVLAGRMLPRGASVFGGQPDTALLDELTYGMSTGRFQSPPVDDSDILNELAPPE